jgi:hypothetical protein
MRVFWVFSRRISQTAALRQLRCGYVRMHKKDALESSGK